MTMLHIFDRSFVKKKNLVSVLLTIQSERLFWRIKFIEFDMFYDIKRIIS